MSAPIRETVKPFFASTEPDQAAVSSWQAGDWVVYRKSKRSKNPGRRAWDIKATQKGETYAYVVDKFWVVERVRPDGTLVVRTPGGKQNTVDADDPNLTKAGWLARIRWGQRFRQIEREFARSMFA
ncbi:MAG: hypothetical protein AAF745_18815 [Planctomycetota bacterium]